MKKILTQRPLSLAFSLRKQAAGFTLLELMVAMGIFLVVGGAAIALLRKHAPAFAATQNQAALNVTLRNSVARLELEVINAGSGYSPNGPLPFSPVGLTIVPAPTPGCPAVGVYTANCFDKLNVISVDSTLPALAPSTDQPAPAQVAPTQVDADTSTGSLYLTWPGNPSSRTPAQYAAWAATLGAGAELLLVQGGTEFEGTGQPSMTVVVLTAPATPGPNYIRLAYSPTDGAGAPSLDPLKIYDIAEAARFTKSFKTTMDYVVRLTSTTYSVQPDPLDATNMQLVRQAGPAAPFDVIADQIVGFNVNAWSSFNAFSTNEYKAQRNPYTNNPANYNSDWASVRSVQVRLMARTTALTDKSQMRGVYRNTYDGGPYQVQGVSVVISPRNLGTN